MMYRNSWIPEVFNGLFNEGNMQKANTTAPAINVKESLTKYTVELAAPGMRKDDFEVNLNENGDLHIKMENKHQPEQEEHVYLRREFSYAKFEQTPDSPRRCQQGEDFCQRSWRCAHHPVA